MDRDPDDDMEGGDSGDEDVNMIQDESDEQDDEDSDEEVDDGLYRVDGRIDERHHAADYIANARIKCNATREAVRHSINSCETLLRARTTHLETCTREFLNANNLMENPASQQLLGQFDIQSPFKAWKSNVGQVNAVKSYYDYIEPRTVYLGQRMDRINIGDNEYGHAPVRETFQYVSIKDILKLVAKKQTVMDYIRNLRPANDDTLSSYIDGEQFATHPFFMEHPDAFQLGFYNDDVETTNPNGSKVGGHTLAYFACKILNAPPHLNAVIGGYHTIALAHTQDVKKYGFRPILQYFIDELRELESPEGVVTYIGPNRIVQRACAVLGDTKAVHEILGFLGSGARHLYRLCMISRPQLHAGIDMEELRDRNLHENHIATNQANPARAVENGVGSEDSCLHDLEYFHATSNYALDSMHDIAEGVAAFEIKLVLRECIRRGYFRSCHLNRRITRYNVGKTDILNKPTDNFSDAALHNAGVKHNLSQTSAQTFCLLRVIPFLLDNLEETPDEDDLLDLLLILQEIVHIVRAPKLTRTLMPYLQTLIEDHRRLFMRLFPNERPINKHHHLEHYVDCILKMGPLEQFNCMRSEASMRPLKRHVVTCGTYRNVCKTAMDLSQITQAVRWGKPGEIPVVPKFELIRKKRPTAIRNCHTAALLRARGFEDEDVVYKVTSVLVYRREFPRSTFVVLRKRVENPDGLEAFGKIIGIIVANDDEDVWLEIEEWTTEYQHPRFNACVVTRPPQPIIHLLDPLDLPLHAPISKLSDNSFTGNTYLKLRHVVV